MSSGCRYASVTLNYKIDKQILLVLLTFLVTLACKNDSINFTCRLQVLRSVQQFTIWTVFYIFKKQKGHSFLYFLEKGLLQNCQHFT